ncbi:DNA topoisomerase 4 subunit A [Auraticoccus sp. F435]|uniref:DNA topoisomerase (ATP-hydrolyzing) n=1 Tax=Auraticoccus cholistanensis TaxID=2656650 RepID=A0A6A9USW2_9ACTN|nr:DNA topoisomerase (ATP-hydrolyzing) [Auraticoccus cholistanensis]MVA75718.1 DNA topoisomerase 4 subunit A [Auraticoccus cholistanensis]
MAKTTPPVDDDFTERILDVDVSAEMQTSFLEYAYSVIYSRALPDARDGLKPVQRRILFTMDQMNLRPDRGHVKCARVVGQVMGLYHPHGDGAIYDALVRLAQPWTMRVPLVDGHGNFGSPDAGPAAMRYTECRMDAAALAMTTGLDQDTVDFRPNYDGKESEPTVLPAAFPNLLVNGTSGIAVGMATNIPPHNLVEVVQALRHLLKHPDATLDTLMRFVPGPDLPTGGKIVGLDGIRDAYATGRGSFKMRATARVEQTSPRRKGIVVSELPLAVGPEKVMEQLKNLVQAKKLQGIADVKDLTDLTHGTRLVIEVKNGFNPDVLLEQLYRLTALETSFGINSVALVDGQPRTLSLHELLTVYLEHRLQVTLRRSRYDRDKAVDRLHLIEGLLIAILDIDSVIAVIRRSDDAAAARTSLMEIFELSEAQASYILDMQLRRLTRFSRIELESERDRLAEEIERLNRIIEDEAVLRQVVGEELAAVAKQFGTPRRTVLLASSGVTAATTAAPLEVADDPCWVLLSSSRLIARTPAGPDGEELPGGGARASHDVLTSRVRTTARGEFGVVTSAGRLVRVQALDLPQIPTTASAPNLQGGVPLSELVVLEPGERVLCLTSLRPDSPGLALGTRQGVVKRVNPEVLNRDAWEVVTLRDGDEVVGAVELEDPDAEELVFITSDAQLLHFPASAVRPQGRSGGGIAGIKLAAGAGVLHFGAARAGASVVTVAGSSSALPGTDTGSAKVTPLDAYPGKGRGTAGVRCMRLLKGEDALLTAWVGPSPAAAAGSGAPVELPAVDPRRDGSGQPVAQPVEAVGWRP